MFRKYYPLYDLPEDIKDSDIPAHVLPLALRKDQYETVEAYEADVFKRLEDLSGYPIVGFIEHQDNK
jgi:hypothetical protein